MRVAAAVAVLLIAVAARADDAPYQFPLGGVVRPGRPVVVRIGQGGAVRVRGGGSPWALPQGPAQEFVLQLPRAGVSLRELEVDRGGRIERIPVEVRDVPAGVTLRAGFGPGADVVLRPDEMPGDVRPRIPEAWLVADEVAEPPPALAPEIRAAIDAWRIGPRTGSRAGFQPLLHPPGPEAFRAAAALAAGAPALPSDEGRALVLLAIVEAAVLVATRRRRAAVRAAWAAGPALVALGWLAASHDLSRAVRATIVCFDDVHGGDRLVLLRVDAPRGGSASFRVPSDATTPALLRYDADDVSGIDSEIGREVRLSLEPGQSRLLAWRVPLADGEAADDAAAPPPPAPVREWLGLVGLEILPGTFEPPRLRDLLPERAGLDPVPVPGLRVAERK